MPPTIADPGVGAPPAFVRLASHPLRWQLLRELVQSDRAVRELMALVDEPQSLVSYHLRLLREGGLVTAHRSSADRRDSYYAIDLDACRDALQSAGAALHPSLRLSPTAPPASTTAPPAPATAGAVPVHGEQRAVPDRRSAARPHVGRWDPGRQRGQPSEATASQRHPRPSCVRDRHQRAPHQAHRRAPLPAVRHGDHPVRPRPGGLPGLPVPTRARPLERARPSPRGCDRPRASYPAFERTAAELETRIRFQFPLFTTAIPRRSANAPG